MKRRFESKYVEDHDLIVLGFNTPKLTDEIFAALVSSGLKIPKPLVNLKIGDRVMGGSNLGKDARYDQILHLPCVPENFTNAGGAVDFHIDDAHIEESFPARAQGLHPRKVHLSNVRSLPSLDPR